MKIFSFITVLVFCSTSFAGSFDGRKPASDDGKARGILYHVNSDGSLSLFLGEGRDVVSAYDDAVKKCAKRKSKSTCDKQNNFDLDIPAHLFTNN